MKHLVLATLLAACTSNANIGVNGAPLTCKPDAEGAAMGTVTNATTHQSYSFGTVAASLSLASPAAPMAVRLDDSSLGVTVQFPCGQPDLGTFDVAPDNTACPFDVSATVFGRLQQVYGTAHAGTVIVDQNVGCLAGRYDLSFGTTLDNGSYVNEGDVAGWFSVPLQ